MNEANLKELLRFFTSNKERDFDIKNVEKVLFFRYDRIGDMVITTPVFRELKLFFPEIKASVLASKTNQYQSIFTHIIRSKLTAQKQRC